MDVGSKLIAIGNIGAAVACAATGMWFLVPVNVSLALWMWINASLDREEDEDDKSHQAEIEYQTRLWEQSRK